MKSLHKGPTYSIMKNTPEGERSEFAARMLSQYPDTLSYFKKSKWYSRPFQIAKMLISNEAYYRKEHERAGLYAVAESHLKDGKTRDVNIETDVKGMLAGTHTHFNPAVKEDAQVLGVVTDVVKAPMDVSKILKDKEWYRWIVRTAVAGLAFLLPAFATLSEKPQAPVVAEVMVVPDDYETTKKSLKECMDALGKKKPRKCHTDTVYRDVPVADTAALDAANKKYADLEASIADIKANSERWDKFKLDLIKKVDNTFKPVTIDSEVEYYNENIRPWFKAGLDIDDMKMVSLVVFMGGEMLNQSVDKETECVTAVSKFRKTSEFSDAYGDGLVTYAGGQSGAFNSWNLKCGNSRALFDYYTSVYNNLAKFMK